MQFGNGRWETAVNNERLQIKQIGLGTLDTNQDLLKLEYSYGTSTQNNGSLREQKITVPTAGSSSPGFTAVQTYTYDNLNRLESAEEKPLNYTQTQCNANPSQCWKQTFLYDRYGNREFNTTTGATTTLNPAVPDKVKNPQINTSDNRFQKDQDNDTLTDYDYDKAGNLIRDAIGWQFFYDAENHQKEVKNANGVTVGTYLYDGDGKRVKKINWFLIIKVKSMRFIGMKGYALVLFGEKKIKSKLRLKSLFPRVVLNRREIFRCRGQFFLRLISD